MKTQKKTARKQQLSSGVVQGLRREPPCVYLLYQVPGKIASPNLDRGGGALPMTWGFLLELIGAWRLTEALFRVMDWIERS